MKRRKLYLYNSETDNFERFYPSLKDRIKSISRIGFIGILLAIGVYFIISHLYETSTIENLTSENHELRQQFLMLEKEVESSRKLMGEIQNRDSNMYRVLLQLEPQSDFVKSNKIVALNFPFEMRKLDDFNLISRLLSNIDSLNLQILNQIVSFNNIREVALHNQDKLNHTPSVLPINISDYTMASGFGIRIDPVYGSHKFHAGIDFAADMGTQVFATADGEISFADPKSGYGNCIDIDHGYNYKTRYAHLSKILVKDGAHVKRGELIGLVGSTGKSTGPHLHYEVYFKEKPQNPVNYYFMDLTPDEYNEMIELAENASHVMD